MMRGRSTARTSSFSSVTTAPCFKSIVHRCQFHHHLTHTFCADILTPKITKPKCNREMLRKAFLYEKRWHKMLKKSKPGLYRTNILWAAFCSWAFLKFFCTYRSISTTFNEQLLKNVVHFFSLFKFWACNFFGKRKLTQNLLVKFWWNFSVLNVTNMCSI